MIDWDLEAEELLRLCEEGETLQQIADRYGLTRERIRQVLNEFGINEDRQDRRAELRRAERERRIAALAPEIVQRWREGQSQQEIAQAVRLLQKEVGRVVREQISELEQKRRAFEYGWQKPATDSERLLQLLREGYAALNGSFTGLTFSAWSRTHGGCTSQTYIKRFGTWANACRLAGVPVPPHPRKRRSDRIPEGRMLFELKQAIAALGHLPSVAEYDQFARKRGYTSIATVRNRFGSWVAALESTYEGSER